MIRLVAIWLRLKRLLQTKQRTTGCSRGEELRMAEYTLIRNVQEEVSPSELLVIRKKESISRRSPLHWYHPNIYKNGLLRVGGHFHHSKKADDTKHPRILPAHHHITQMVFEHFRLLNAGPQILLGTVRQRY